MPHLASVVLKPVGAPGSLSFAATSSRPPMPTVLLITNRPRLRTPSFEPPLQGVVDDAVDFRQIAEEIVHPGANRRGHAAIHVRHRQKDRLVEARIEPVGEPVQPLPRDRRSSWTAHPPASAAAPRRLALGRSAFGPPRSRPCRRPPAAKAAALSRCRRIVRRGILRRQAADAHALAMRSRRARAASSPMAAPSLIARLSAPPVQRPPACRACRPPAAARRYCRGARRDRRRRSAHRACPRATRVPRLSRIRSSLLVCA